MENSAAFIDGYLVHDKLGKDEPITFCIDTGACATSLFDREVVAFGIDLHTLKRGYDSRGVGGTANTCLLENAKIKFLIGAHQWAIVSFEAIHVIVPRKNLCGRIIDVLTKLIPRKTSKSMSDERRGLPNLLGFDFLRDCKISFSQTEVYLDVEVS